MQQADVAVVIPVYNRASTVLRTLSAVAEQSLAPRRIIVVDDGSLDGTPDAVARWGGGVRCTWELELIRQENQGAGAARNRGLQAIGDCRYVAFLDSDDCWPADFLSRMIAQMDAAPTAVAATADRRYHRQRKQRAGFHTTRGIARNASTWLMTHDAGIASATLFRADVVQRLGGFDRSIPSGQDIELFLRVSAEGRWLYVPGTPVDYYVGFSAIHGEEANLSGKWADRKRRWVQIREKFIFRQKGRDLVPEQVYGRALAKLWRRAAEDYAIQGRNAFAAACYRKALAYRPLHLMSWWHYAHFIASLRT